MRKIFILLSAIYMFCSCGEKALEKIGNEEKGVETQNFGKLKEKTSSNSTENADIVIFLLKIK